MFGVVVDKRVGARNGGRKSSPCCKSCHWSAKANSSNASKSLVRWSRASSLTCHASRARLAKCVMVASSIKVAPIPLPSLSRFLSPIDDAGCQSKDSLQRVAGLFDPACRGFYQGMVPADRSCPPTLRGLSSSVCLPSSSHPILFCTPRANTTSTFTRSRGDAGPTASPPKRRYVPDAADGGCRSLNTLTLNSDNWNHSFLPYIQVQVQYP
jgi:hypothetical protein